MKFWKYLAVSASVLAAPHAFACFTVYNTANQVVYSGLEPPIDMSYQIHELLPAAFPGGHMVFGTDSECRNIDLRRQPASFSGGYVAASTGRPVRGARADRN